MRSGLLLARGMDEAGFAVWLGAEVKLPSGYTYALSERVKEILKAAFAAKDVDVQDVLKDGMKLDEPEFNDLRAAWLG